MTCDFYDFAAVRYFSNGTIDTTFGVAGKVRTDFGDQNFDRARSPRFNPMAGSSLPASLSPKTEESKISRLRAIPQTASSTPHLVATENPNRFRNCCQSATKLLLQSDGKIITVGGSNGESSEDDFLLARLNPRGSLDNTFGVGGQVRTSFGDLNGGANGAALQSDGKIVAVGFQATFSNQWANFALARYLSQ